VVILSHLSYASGNGSSGMPIPSREVAVERIDNFANGFLASGARIVWHLGWQPGADVIDALATSDATMDAVFMTRYREPAAPMNGWIGADPGYYDSLRTPGARIHIDPDAGDGYLRAITGDLDFTTTEWRTVGAAPPDTEPPIISDVTIQQAAVTLSADVGLPIFTPNGDGLSDSVKITHTLSENAFLGIRVFREETLIREMSVWSMRGRGSSVWDGRRDDGEYAKEGRYRIQITPTDRAGNVGQPAVAKVLVLNAMRDPAFRPAFFYPSDGDALAATANLGARLSKPSKMSWLIRDEAGTVVRHGGEGIAMQPGMVRFAWDGRDDAGQFVPQGRYVGRIRVTRPSGSYGHDVAVHVMPFDLQPATWKPRLGDEVRLWFSSAEPLRGKPIVMARLPGLTKAPLRVIKVDHTTFKALLPTRKALRPGRITVRAIGTDSGAGTQTQTWTLRLD
jgi:flagellar hook assembly protein FlgD